MTGVEPGMSFLENLSSVPNLVHGDKNLRMQYFENMLAVPKPAFHCKNPWMANSLKGASVPKTFTKGAAPGIGECDSLILNILKQF